MFTLQSFFSFLKRVLPKRFKFFINRGANFILSLSHMTGLLKLRSSIQGRDCFVLGSAPNPDLSLFREGMALVTVNGSAANAKALNLPTPSITLMDFEVLDKDVNTFVHSRAVVLEALKGLDLGVLIAAQSNGSKGGKPEILKARYNYHLKIFKEARRLITHNVSGTTLLENDVYGLTSNGAFAIALCAFLGARSVTFSGFSLFKSGEHQDSPHFYKDLGIDTGIGTRYELTEKNVDTRSHSLADCALITQLVLSGHSIITNNRDFLPLIQNWGNDPPAWAIRK